MYKNYKVVVNTAAGRRRYMQYLIPYIVSSENLRVVLWGAFHQKKTDKILSRFLVEFVV